LHAPCVFFGPSQVPPGSPLFPYTTLFRSVGVVGVERARGVAQEALCEEDPAGGDRTFVAEPLRHGREELLVAPRGRPLERRCRRDRKSTRLNSSHLGISYAVFCLKKKKRH